MLDKINLNRYKESIGSRDKSIYHELPIEQVDSEVDELVRVFNNPEFRKWYCLVVRELGIEKVHELKVRAEEGSQPGKLFSKLAKEAMTYKSYGGTDRHGHG